jgi:hypothetical protein
MKQKSRRMAGHVAYMRQNVKAYEALVRKIKRNTALLEGL